MIGWAAFNTLIQGQSQAFGGSAGFEEFIQLNRMGRVAVSVQPCHRFRTAGRQDDMAINTYGVTGKPFGFGRWNRKPFALFNMGCNHGLCVPIERGRKVQQLSTA